MVIAYETEDLTGKPRFLLADALHWDITRIIRTWNYRWSIEVFHEFAKQTTGLESSQVRKEEAVKRHFRLSCVAQSLLQKVNKGFRFLKDPLFFTSSVFVNTPRRVAALAMVMGLCLLVYTLGQRQLRQALAHAQETIHNQLKKPTSTPTLRWVFQCFQAIHLVHFNRQLQVSNLTDARLKILRFLGHPCQKYYLIC